MGQTFHCKEKDCPLSVKYVAQTNPGGIGFQTRRLALEKVVVYLTCENGHIHGYTVQTVQGGAGDA